MEMVALPAWIVGALIITPACLIAVVVVIMAAIVNNSNRGPRCDCREE